MTDVTKPLLTDPIRADAARIFNVALAEVTADQRATAEDYAFYREALAGVPRWTVGLSEIYARITDERARQEAKWGDQSAHSDLLHAAILGEEVGEAQHAVLERDYANLVEELVQVAAVAVKWLQALTLREEVRR